MAFAPIGSVQDAFRSRADSEDPSLGVIERALQALAKVASRSSLLSMPSTCPQTSPHTHPSLSNEPFIPFAKPLDPTPRSREGSRPPVALADRLRTHPSNTTSDDPVLEYQLLLSSVQVLNYSYQFSTEIDLDILPDNVVRTIVDRVSHEP